MLDRTFPLHALPAFAAAARYKSFKSAACALHLTPSAVSHQIKQLEAALGVALFRRLPRGLDLTVAGVRYAQVVTAMLDRIHREGEAVAGRTPRMQIRFSMPDFVALADALPHLDFFSSAYPDIELDISTGFELADLEGGQADAAIRFGRGCWSGLDAHKLASCYGIVAAESRLASSLSSKARRLPVVGLSVLKVHTQRMLTVAGLHGPLHLLWLDTYAGVVAAAKQGLGVAVIYMPRDAPLPACDLTPLACDLTPLKDAPVAAGFDMYFVCRSGEGKRPEMIAARTWATNCFGHRVWFL